MGSYGAFDKTKAKPNVIQNLLEKSNKQVTVVPVNQIADKKAYLAEVFFLNAQGEEINLNLEMLKAGFDYSNSELGRNEDTSNRCPNYRRIRELYEDFLQEQYIKRKSSDEYIPPPDLEGIEQRVTY